MSGGFQIVHGEAVAAQVTMTKTRGAWFYRIELTAPDKDVHEFLVPEQMGDVLFFLKPLKLRKCPCGCGRKGCACIEYGKARCGAGGGCKDLRSVNE